MTILSLTNGFYVDESRPLSDQECVNLYVEKPEVQANSEIVLKGVPGIIEYFNTGLVQQQNRGSWTKGTIPYLVNGTKLYNVTREIVGSEYVYTLNELGDIEGSDRLSFASSPTELCILIPGGKGYIYNEESDPALVEITDLDFRANGNPLYVVYVDGYFLFTTDEDKIITCNLNQGLVYDALDFASVESDPDAVVAPIITNNQVYVTGTITTEGFRNIGGGGFGFQRNNVFLDKGCYAPHTLIRTNQTYFMVGGGQDEDPAIWQFAGNNYKKISTLAIDQVLAKYDAEDIANAFSFYQGFKGHFWVGFTFPDHTFIYDLSNNYWHERRSLDQEREERWRINSMTSAYGKVWVGDYEDGRIGVVEAEQLGEYGEDIISQWATRPYGSMEGFVVPALELFAETGVGNENVIDPKVSLSISQNGQTYGNEYNRSLGKIGEYKHRIVWRRLGRISTEATFKFRISDQVKKVVRRLESL